MANTMTVKVGRGLFEAMQLDDASVIASYGITLAVKGGRLLVTATPDNLRKLAQACDANSWNVEARYARSSAAARDAINKALAGGR